MIKHIDILQTKEQFYEIFGDTEGEIKFRLHCIKHYPDSSEGYGDITSLENLLSSYNIMNLLIEVRANEFLYNKGTEEKSKQADYLIETIVTAYRELLKIKRIYNE